MSSLELNKIAGAILVGGIVALVSGIIADQLVEPKPVERHAVAVAGAEGQGGEKPAAAEKPAGIEPVSPLLASADTAAGEKISQRCHACHTFEKGGPNKVGPNLWGIVGGPKAHSKSFSYSDAIASLGGTWSYEDLNHFLASPRNFAPGTKMTFAGLSKVQDRANLIAWLRTQNDNPPPLPEATAAAGGAAGAAEGGQPPAPAATAQPGEESKAPAQTQGQQAAAPAGGGGGVDALLASADPKAGEKISKRCAACHSFDKGGPNKVGPNLWNIVGAPQAHLKDFNYSKAISGLGGKWTYENLDHFLTAPSKYAPGTKMTFAGIKKPEDRADLIAWLREQSDNPQPLP